MSQGWTYGVSSRISVSTGRLYVNFYRASDLANAYPAFREMVQNYTRAKDPIEWDRVLLDSAVRKIGTASASTIFELSLTVVCLTSAVGERI